MSREVRQKLMWTAIKARKGNLIDQKALDIISRLVKEPSCPDTDAKIQSFANEFFRKVSGNASKEEQDQAEATSRRSIIGQDVLYLRLPSALHELISRYLSFEDSLNLANTCFVMNGAVFPPEHWIARIRAAFLQYGLRPSNAPTAGVVNNLNQGGAEVEEAPANPLFPHPPVIQEIQPPAGPGLQIAPPGAASLPPPYFDESEAEKILSVLDKHDNLFMACASKEFLKEDSPSMAHQDRVYIREKVLTLFARGSHLLCQGDQRSMGYEIMLRYLIPRLASGSLQTKVLCSINVPGKGRLVSGPPLLLTHACGARSNVKDHVWLKFQPPYNAIPPVIGTTSILSLHALERDGRTVSLVRSWQVGGIARNAMIPLMMERAHGVVLPFQEDLITLPGNAGVTLVGERSARELGKLIHNDEMAFSVEIRTSAQGGHGQGSFDVRNEREVVNYQTPRIGFKAPGYFEISRNGVEINVPIWLLFTHVV